MARYAGGGKNTVEGCRSIDVLDGISSAISDRRGGFPGPGPATASGWRPSTSKPNVIT